MRRYADADAAACRVDAGLCRHARRHGARACYDAARLLCCSRYTPIRYAAYVTRKRDTGADALFRCRDAAAMTLLLQGLPFIY